MLDDSLVASCHDPYRAYWTAKKVDKECLALLWVARLEGACPQVPKHPEGLTQETEEAPGMTGPCQ